MGTVLQTMSAEEQFRSVSAEDWKEMYGNLDNFIHPEAATGKAVVRQDIAAPAFNKSILEERQMDEPKTIEDRRRIPAEMIGGLTDKMVEMYRRVPDPVKAIYGELKSKIAGPLKVEAITPTANICLSTKGLDCAHKFFPSVEEIEAHPGFDLDGDESGEEEAW